MPRLLQLAIDAEVEVFVRKNAALVDEQLELV